MAVPQPYWPCPNRHARPPIVMAMPQSSWPCPNRHGRAPIVMAGLDPAIHAARAPQEMAGTRPAMTIRVAWLVSVSRSTGSYHHRLRSLPVETLGSAQRATARLAWGDACRWAVAGNAARIGAWVLSLPVLSLIAGRTVTLRVVRLAWGVSRDTGMPRRVAPIASTWRSRRVRQRLALVHGVLPRRSHRCLWDGRPARKEASRFNRRCTQMHADGALDIEAMRLIPLSLEVTLTQPAGLQTHPRASAVEPFCLPARRRDLLRGAAATDPAVPWRAVPPALCGKRHLVPINRKRRRHPRERGDPTGMGPPFAGMTIHCGVCYIVPRSSRCMGCCLPCPAAAAARSSGYAAGAWSPSSSRPRCLLVRNGCPRAEGKAPGLHRPRGGARDRSLPRAAIPFHRGRGEDGVRPHQPRAYALRREAGVACSAGTDSRADWLPEGGSSRCRGATWT